jgi:Lon-like ATP-dependent protease
MATSLLSLGLNHPLDPTIAMTGELTVTGKVLRIGGLREKTVAARRAGAKKIIFPADNMSDWLELPEVSAYLSGTFGTLKLTVYRRTSKQVSMATQ